MAEENNEQVEALRALNDQLLELRRALGDHATIMANSAKKADAETAKAAGNTSAALRRLSKATDDQTEAEKSKAKAEKEYEEAMYNFKQALGSTTAGLKSFGSALISGKEGFEKYNSTISSAGDAAMALGKNFGLVGMAAGALVKGFTMAAEKMTKQADNVLSATDQISKMGAANAFTAEQVRQMGQRAGLSSDELGKMIKPLQSMSGGLTRLGTTSEEGVKKFNDMISVSEETRREFRRLGLSDEERIQAQADYIGMMERTGSIMLKGDKTQAALQKASLDYTRNLYELSAITGKSIEESKKDIEISRATTEAKLYENKMARAIQEARARGDDEEAKRLTAELEGFRNFSKEIQAQLQDPVKTAAAQLQFLTGAVTKESAQFKIIGVELEDSFEKIRNGSYRAGEFSDAYKDALQGQLDANGQAIALSEGYRKAAGINDKALDFANKNLERNIQQAAAQGAAPVQANQQGQGPAATDPAQQIRNDLIETERKLRLAFDDAIAGLNPLINGFGFGTLAIGALAAAASLAAARLGYLAGKDALGGLIDNVKGKKGPKSTIETRTDKKGRTYYVDTETGKRVSAEAAKAAETAAKVPTATASGTAAKVAGKAIPVAGAVIATGLAAKEGYEGYQKVEEQVKKGEITKQEGTVKKSEAVGSATGAAAGGTGGAIAGAAAGAALGSVVPVVGTIIGGLLGAAVGGYLGSKGGEVIGKSVGTAVGNSISEKDVSKAAEEASKKPVPEAKPVTPPVTQTPVVPQAKPVTETPTAETRTPVKVNEIVPLVDANIKNTVNVKLEDKVVKVALEKPKEPLPVNIEKVTATIKEPTTKNDIKETKLPLDDSFVKLGKAVETQFSKVNTVFKDAFSPKLPVQEKPFEVTKVSSDLQKDFDRIKLDTFGILNKSFGEDDTPVTKFNTNLENANKNLRILTTSFLRHNEALTSSMEDIKAESFDLAVDLEKAEREVGRALNGAIFDVQKIIKELPKVAKSGLVDSSGRPVTDSSGQPIRTGVPESAPPVPALKQDVKENLEDITKSLAARGMDDDKYIKAILGNVLKETGGKAVSENLDYSKTSNERIRSIFGERAAGKTDEELDVIKRDPTQMGEMMYGSGTKIGRQMGNTDVGDGWKYRGRGYIQLTGKNNYAEASKAIFGDDRLVKDPDLVNNPKVAAEVTAWYMEKGKTKMATNLGINTKDMTQEQANLLATSQVAGKAITPGQGYLGGEALGKVDNYVSALSKPQSGTGQTMMAGAKDKTAPTSQVAQLGKGDTDKIKGPDSVLQFAGATGTLSSFRELDGNLQKNVMLAAEEYFRATGKKLQVNSAKRDSDDQQRLYDETVAAGRPGIGPTGMRVGQPGTSSHELGQAIDIQQGKSDQLAIDILNKYGLKQTVANDPVHFAFPKANDGGIGNGPETGYPVELHGRELIQPIDPNSVLEKLATLPADQPQPTVTTASGTDTILKEMKDMQAQFYTMMIEKFDNMIDELGEGNSMTNNLLKYSRN